MTYYTNLFSPETYVAFSESKRDVSGFRIRQKNVASQIKPGDRFICYVTKISRWVGILEIMEEYFEDDTPLFYTEDDPYVIRFRVKAHVWLPKEKAIPIHENGVWNHLSFTQEHSKNSTAWTGKLRASLNQITEQDGQFLEELLEMQKTNGLTYPIDGDYFQKLVGQRIRREDKTVTVTVPQEDETETNTLDEPTIRESYRIQALLAQIGESMGFKIWLPRSDRSNVLQEWKPSEDVLLNELPLNYDETTLKTIEQIDMLWLNRRSIFRAFEVEHSTAIYSGILRMADLLALQPNMNIRLHIVAPFERRDKVLQEIQRPVFSLLDRAPLSEICTFISYDSVMELSEERYISHMSDAVLEEYTEES
ncbi:MAG: EVE domain-containing protein [Gemmatimonadetes bacterium]|nr:EVE domain-containing protein [Gemmatimonadota bacterium]